MLQSQTGRGVVEQPGVESAVFTLVESGEFVTKSGAKGKRVLLRIKAGDLPRNCQT
jgi:hypothetical protein